MQAKHEVPPDLADAELVALVLVPRRPWERLSVALPASYAGYKRVIQGATTARRIVAAGTDARVAGYAYGP
jgi:hypothetical protein